MFPPRQTAIRQRLAHATRPAGFAFARPSGFAQDGSKTVVFMAGGLFCDDCYPSPYPRPGPLWVRLSFVRGMCGRKTWRRIADLVQRHSLGFQLLPKTVDYALIKTITRGSVTCGNRPLLSWQFVQPPLRDACKPPNSVAWRVLSVAHFWPMHLTKTWLPVRPLGGLPVRLLAVCQAFHAVTDLIAAQAAASNVSESHPGRAPWMAFFCLRGDCAGTGDMKAG